MLGVSWTIAGSPVPLQWSSMEMTAPGGFGNLGQVILPRETLPPGTDVFSPVVGTRTDGVPFYVGEITGPPHISQGLVTLQVGGLQGRLARQRGRRLYQSTDLSRWVNADAEPHRYGLTAGTIPATASGIADFQQTVSTGEASVLFWAKGELIQRVAFTVSGSAPSWNLRSAVGPQGSRTSEATGGAGTFDEAITSTALADQVDITVSATVDTRVAITNLRVNGRASGDTFSSIELGQDIADWFDWDNLSVEGSPNVLPLEWDGDWPGGLSEAAGLFDGTWLVLPPVSEDLEGSFYLGPWGRHTWTVRGADYTDLVPQLRYNKVAVGYTTQGGVPLESLATATPDPYAGTGLEVVWPPGGPYQISAPLVSSSTADDAASTLIRYWSQPRVTGQVEIGRLWGMDGEAHPWDIDAGDLVELPELQTLGDAIGSQRVVEVSKHADGTATISVGEATSLVGLLGTIESTGEALTFDIDVPERARRRRQKKRKRKRKGRPGPDWTRNRDRRPRRR